MLHIARQHVKLTKENMHNFNWVRICPFYKKMIFCYLPANFCHTRMAVFCEQSKLERFFLLVWLTPNTFSPVLYINQGHCNWSGGDWLSDRDEFCGCNCNSLLHLCNGRLWPFLKYPTWLLPIYQTSFIYPSFYRRYGSTFLNGGMYDKQEPSSLLGFRKTHMYCP